MRNFQRLGLRRKKTDEEKREYERRSREEQQSNGMIFISSIQVVVTRLV